MQIITTGTLYDEYDTTGLASQRGADGRTDAPNGLVEDSAWTNFRLVGQPSDGSEFPARQSFSALALVGAAIHIHI